jgi:branched-subunit amino acid ABC-type transport system permease component
MNLFFEAIGFGVVAAASISLGAMGFSIQFGLTNMLNISYGVMMTIGGLVTYACAAGPLTVWVGLVLAGVVTALVTLLLGKTVFAVFVRKGTPLFEMVMVTFAVTLVGEYGIAAITQNNTYVLSVGAQHALSLGPFKFTLVQLIFVFLAIGIYVLIELLLRLTKLGKALRATAADADLAQCCGIPTGRIVGVAWLLSGFLCGLAGGMFAVDILTLNAFTGDSLLPLVIVAALVGTAGSVRGAVLASIGLGVGTQLVTIAWNSAFSTVVAYGTLALVLILRPGLLQGGDIADKKQITV